MFTITATLAHKQIFFLSLSKRTSLASFSHSLFHKGSYIEKACTESLLCIWGIAVRYVFYLHIYWCSPNCFCSDTGISMCLDEASYLSTVQLNTLLISSYERLWGGKGIRKLATQCLVLLKQQGWKSWKWDSKLARIPLKNS